MTDTTTDITASAKVHARRLEYLAANGGPLGEDLKSSTYALSGEAIISEPGEYGGRPLVDIRRVLLMVAGGGPTAYLAFDHEGRGYYLTNEASTHSELAEYYLGDDYSNIANYLAEKLGGWDY